MRLACIAALSILLVPSAAAADRAFDIEAGTNGDGSMYLRPDDIRVLPGDKVTLRVHNVDGIFHDVAILSYNGEDIEVEVPAHETKERTFTAAKEGDFRMVCEVTGHKQKGMQGTFHVGEAKSPAAPVAAALVALAAAAALRRR